MAFTLGRSLRGLKASPDYALEVSDVQIQALTFDLSKLPLTRDEYLRSHIRPISPEDPFPYISTFSMINERHS